MKKRNIIILIILLIIGFATVSTSLILNGTIGIGVNQNDFDVYFSNASLDGELRNDLISSDGKKINFASKVLKNINDTSELEYEVINNSTQYDVEVSIDLNYPESDEYTVTNEFDSDIISAGTRRRGKIIVTLNKSLVEDKSIELLVNIRVNAVSKSSVVGKDDSEKEYIIGGYLLDKNNNILPNKNIVVYSDKIDYATTDEQGYLFLSGLERGTYQLYYFEDTSLEEIKKMSIDEINDNSTSTSIITTSASSVVFDNGIKVNDLHIDKSNNLKVLTIHEAKEYTRIVDENNKTFLIPELAEWTNLRVNKGASVEYHNNVLTINEMKEAADVYFSNSVVSNVNSMDSSENLVIMLKDETLTSHFNHLTNKKLIFDLNSHTIYFPSSACKLVSGNVYNNVISIRDGSNLILKNGTIFNNESMKCGLSDVSGSLKMDNMKINMNTATAIWVRHTADVVINNSTLKYTTEETTGSIVNVYSTSTTDVGGHLTIENSTLESPGRTLVNPHGGTIDIINSNIYSTATGNVIASAGGGTINIKGEQARFDENDKYLSGTYIHSDQRGQLINATGLGTINVYNGTLRQLFTGDPVGSCVIYLGAGNLNIYDGELYSYRDFAVYEAHANSIVKIYNGVLKSNRMPSIAHDRGDMYILGGTIESATAAAVSNYTGNLYISGGTYNGKTSITSPGYQDKISSKTYICGGKYESSVDIDIKDGTAYVYYKDNIEWSSGTEPIVTGTISNAIKDSSITCKVIEEIIIFVFITYF